MNKVGRQYDKADMERFYYDLILIWEPFIDKYYTGLKSNAWRFVSDMV